MIFDYVSIDRKKKIVLYIKEVFVVIHRIVFFAVVGPNRLRLEHNTRTYDIKITYKLN